MQDVWSLSDARARYVCTRPPVINLFISSPAGFSCVRLDGAGLRDICRAKPDTTIGCPDVSEGGVGLRDPCILLDSPAPTGDWTWASCQRCRADPSLHILYGFELGGSTVLCGGDDTHTRKTQPCPAGLIKRRVLLLNLGNAQAKQPQRSRKCTCCCLLERTGAVLQHGFQH